MCIRDRFSPALMRIGKYGSALNAGLSIESIEVEETENRFINQPGIVEPRLFSHQQFLGIDLGYTFQNYDEPAQPSTGMSFNIQGGWKFNLNNTKRQVPYVESSIAFTLPLTLTKKFVLATRLKGKKLFSNDYDFFQGASLGGTDLRGYRNERFLGKQSFVHSSDLRLRFPNFKKSFIPMNLGVFGGFDYGRVWLQGEDSNSWHSATGGGLWLNAINMISLQTSYFKGKETGRFTFGIGFTF